MATTQIITPKVTASLSVNTVVPGQQITFTWSTMSTQRITITGVNIDFVPTGALKGDRTITVPMSAKYGTKIQVQWSAFSSTGRSVAGSVTATVVNAPLPLVVYPIVDLTATPSESVKPGESATIKWQSKDAAKLTVTAPGWSPTVSSTLLAGTLTSAPPVTPATYNVNVKATSLSGLVKDFNFPVKVTPPPAAPGPVVTPVITGTFSPVEVAPGQTSTLTWTSTGVTSLLLSGSNYQLSAATLTGSAVVTVPFTFTDSKIVINYTAAATSGPLKGSFTLPVKQVAPAPTPTALPKVTFTITYYGLTPNPGYNPTTKPIPAGSPFTLAWSSENTTSLKLAGLGLNINTTTELNGIRDLTAPATGGAYYINVNAVGPAGTNTTTEMFQVGASTVPVVPVADPVITAAFEPSTVNINSPCTFNWSSTGATAVTVFSETQLNIYSSTATSGTRTITSPLVPGIYRVELSAFTLVNGAPKVVSKFVSLTVIDPAQVRLLGVINLPDCTVGTAYSYTYSASGGIPPYKFSTLYGQLPNGLTLNSISGVVSGTPILTKLTQASFTVAVTDSQNKTDRLDGIIKIK